MRIHGTATFRAKVTNELIVERRHQSKAVVTLVGGRGGHGVDYRNCVCTQQTPIHQQDAARGEVDPKQPRSPSPRANPGKTDVLGESATTFVGSSLRRQVALCGSIQHSPPALPAQLSLACLLSPTCPTCLVFLCLCLPVPRPSTRVSASKIRPRAGARAQHPPSKARSWN